MAFVAVFSIVFVPSFVDATIVANVSAIIV